MFCKNPENDIITIYWQDSKDQAGHNKIFMLCINKRWMCSTSFYKPIFYQGKSLCRFDRNIGDRGVKPPTHSLLRIYSGSNFFSGKITLPRGISTGLWKITSLALLGMLFSTNQSRFPSVKWFSLKKKLPPL